MTVLVTQDNGITTIAIDRPDHRNAVDPATARALYAAFLAFEASEDQQVAVFTGTGGAFCAGFDLKAAGAGHLMGGSKKSCCPTTGSTQWVIRVLAQWAHHD